jgi:hypothetical protein
MPTDEEIGQGRCFCATPSAILAKGLASQEGSLPWRIHSMKNIFGQLPVQLFDRLKPKRDLGEDRLIDQKPISTRVKIQGLRRPRKPLAPRKNIQQDVAIDENVQASLASVA